ncbi:SOS response-associated peptidase family protein [Wenyingzhuangia fucanilytica]|nr:SOS response-associated peptidase family protein [Wenyingzhuangia fucanilytica]
MKFKISNMATPEALIEFTGIPLKHPELYKKSYMITGKEETIVPIITQENKQEISFAIWGLLPENYDEDWLEFQNLVDTLTIKSDELKNNEFINKIKNINRCLILVTGFFTTYLKNGKTHQYFISAKENHPFYLAGYYNKLDDGFLTFTLLLTPQNEIIKKYQNLTKYMPTILDSEDDKNLWLSDEITINQIEEFIPNSSCLPLNITQVKDSLEYS